MSFEAKWRAAVDRKGSLLCVGMDPQESETGSAAKMRWCHDIIEACAPYTAAIKINRNYIKDLARESVSALVKSIHDHGMVAIDDSKLADIGESNRAGLIHAKAEGFDSVTYAPFPGNVQETAQAAASLDIGLIVLVLMSNPEYAVLKNASIAGMLGYEYFAREVAITTSCGMVIGAPSVRNHITPGEITRVKTIAGQRIVLVPGMGAQGGDVTPVIDAFGELTIANVGRSVVFAPDVAAAARQYRDRINISWRPKQC